MNKNLFQIQEEYNKTLQELESYCIEHNTDEIPQELLDKLVISSEDLGDKLDAYHHKDLELKAEEEMLAAYIKNLTKRKKSIVATRARIKGYAGVAIEAFGEKNNSGNHVVKTPLHKVTAQRSKKLVIVDTHLLPDEYLTKETVELVTVDNSALKKAILASADEEIWKGAAYIDRSNLGITFR